MVDLMFQAGVMEKRAVNFVRMAKGVSRAVKPLKKIISPVVKNTLNRKKIIGTVKNLKRQTLLKQKLIKSRAVRPSSGVRSSVFTRSPKTPLPKIDPQTHFQKGVGKLFGAKKMYGSGLNNPSQATDFADLLGGGLRDIGASARDKAFSFAKTPKGIGTIGGIYALNRMRQK